MAVILPSGPCRLNSIQPISVTIHKSEGPIQVSGQMLNIDVLAGWHEKNRTYCRMCLGEIAFNVLTTYECMMSSFGDGGIRDT